MRLYMRDRGSVTELRAQPGSEMRSSQNHRYRYSTSSAHVIISAGKCRNIPKCSPVTACTVHTGTCAHDHVLYGVHSTVVGSEQAAARSRSHERSGRAVDRVDSMLDAGREVDAGGTGADERGQQTPLGGSWRVRTLATGRTSAASFCCCFAE
jgi:hypothetical protein